MGSHSAERDELGDVVDLDRGLVSRRIFHDPELYERERARVFGRSWLFLAHESQLPAPGDYITCRMGETPVIVARDAAGRVHAFLNSCRHRGNPVTRNDCGNARTFTCPYHGWCYELRGKRVDAGSLVGLPGTDTYYHGRLDLASWGLVPVAQVDAYRGLIFGNFDPAAPPLQEYLGEFCWFLDTVLGRGGDLAAVPGVVRWRIDCNWKFAADNAIGDNAHGQVAHRSAVMTISKLRGQRAQFGSNQVPGITVLSEYGHGANCRIGNGTPVVAEDLSRSTAVAAKLHIDPVFERWRENPEVMGRLDPLQRSIQRYNANVFPNLFLIDRLLMLRNPLGPGATEIRAIALFDRSGDAETQVAEKRLAFQKFGPSGLYEQEDGENWSQATAGARVEAMRGYPLHYAMGLGTGQILNGDGGPSRIGSMVNEHAQLWFYRFWADAMRARDWDDLRLHHAKPSGTM